MEDLLMRIDKSRLPEHVAVIMDGNGRWAKKRGKPRIFGHRNGVKSVRELSEAAAELGIGWLTVYAFSTENWNRPRLEVNALMKLLVDTMHKEVDTLNKNNIRLKAIGDIDHLPNVTRKALVEGIKETENNSRMTLTLALNYSGRWELSRAAAKIAEEVRDHKLSPEDVDESVFSQYLSTAGMPDPELMIRTSGETRISNYLLWQLAYAELYFTEVHWPDFRKQHFYQALIDFQNRERRFGMTGEQMSSAINQTTE